MQMKCPKVEDAAVLCMVVGVTIYLNTLNCGLCFDDEQAIIKNKDLRPDTPWSEILYHDFWGTPMADKDSHKSYRPLCVATFRLNYLLHELQPMGYHLVNVLLHGAVCYLYVQLCGVVFSQVWPALIAGLLYAVHPIHTEAVAGVLVVGRADILSALLFLTCLLSYNKAVSRSMGGAAGRYNWMAAALLSFVCSALCKETGVTSAAVCLAWDILIIQKCRISRLPSVQNLSVQHLSKSIRRPFLLRILTVCASAFLFMWFRLSLMKQPPLFGVSLNPAVGQHFPHRQLHWAYLCFYNLWLLLSPSLLSPDYSMGTIPLITSVFDMRNVLTLVTFSSLAYFSSHQCRHEKTDTIPLFAIILTIFPFLPASNLFFPVGFVVAERVLYLPSMGFCMLVACGAWHMINVSSSHSLRIGVSVAMALLLVLHSVRTLERNRAWMSEDVLYSEAVRTHPTNAKMLHNLAARVSERDPVMAERLLRLSAAVEPNYVSAFSDLGLVLYKQDKQEEAEKTYWKAVDLTYQALQGNMQVTSSVNSLKAFTRLAKLLKQNTSRLLEAYQLCDNITRHLNMIGVPCPKIFAEKGEILIRMGNYTAARKAVRTALSQDSKNVVAIISLARLESREGRVSEAEVILRRAVEVLGFKLPLVVEMAAHLIHYHHDDAYSIREAENLLKNVLSADPQNVEAMLSLGLIYSDGVLSDVDKAVKLFKEVLCLVPAHEGAMLSLAKLYSVHKRCKEANDILDSLSEKQLLHSKVAMELKQVCSIKRIQ